MQPKTLNRVCELLLAAIVSAAVATVPALLPAARIPVAILYLAIVVWGSLTVVWEGEPPPSQAQSNDLMGMFQSTQVQVQRKVYLLKPSERLRLVCLLVTIVIAGLLGFVGGLL